MYLSAITRFKIVEVNSDRIGFGNCRLPINPEFLKPVSICRVDCVRTCWAEFQVTLDTVPPADSESLKPKWLEKLAIPSQIEGLLTFLLSSLFLPLTEVTISTALYCKLSKATILP
jgi:hypothetical protein